MAIIINYRSKKTIVWDENLTLKELLEKSTIEAVDLEYANLYQATF